MTVLLFYSHYGCQKLSRSVQFSPHLPLFYCSLAALLLSNGGGRRRQEKLVPIFPTQSNKLQCEGWHRSHSHTWVCVIHNIRFCSSQ